LIQTTLFESTGLILILWLGLGFWCRVVTYSTLLKCCVW